MADRSAGSHLAFAPRRREGRATWRSCRAFGANLLTNFPFSFALPAATGAAELEIRWEPARPAPWAQRPWQRRYASRYRLPDGVPVCYFYESAGTALFEYPRIAEVVVEEAGITCFARCPIDGPQIEIYLLGTVLAFWFEQRGLRALHASAVDLEGGAVAFMAEGGEGKSTLAAAFARAGCPFMTDDLFVVENRQGTWHGRPAYPQSRLWPASARYLSGSIERWAREHPVEEKRQIPVGPEGIGCFCPEPRPLAGIYLPEREPAGSGPGAVRIEPISLREGMIALIRHSFIAPMVEVLGWQPHRLDCFASLLRQVPLRRVHYPAGLEYLPRVCEAIVADSRGRGGAAGP
jgi:hypothetical protein